jgi:hypothetical protein
MALNRGWRSGIGVAAGFAAMTVAIGSFIVPGLVWS